MPTIPSRKGPFRRGSTKFGNVPEEGNWLGRVVRFASKKECEEAQILQLRARDTNRPIRNLRRQVAYPLAVNGVHICDYLADFVYDEFDGSTVVEDVKGFRTPEYELKKKLMLAIYKITIKEI